MLDPTSGHSTATALPAPDGQATTAAMDTRTAARTRADELGLTPPTVRGPPPERKRGLSHDVGVVLPCDDVGVGRAVVLLHAGVADRRMWADLVPELAAAGYRAIALDLPGFGDAAERGYAPHMAVLETLDALEVERAALVGNSFGGAVALRVAALARDRVTSMVLVSAPAPNLEPSPELEAVWEAEESALERGDLDGALAAVVEAWTLADAPAGLRDRVAVMQRRTYEPRASGGEGMPGDDPLEPDSSALSTLEVPALVAVGELDMRDFHVGAEALARQLPQSRLMVIPGAGHLAPLEQPESFRQLVLDHLGET
jgi:3-oxoadipate enol-lactonase